MNKSLIIIILCLILLIGVVSAIPKISDVSIDPENPTISDDIKICANVVDDSEISIVRINLRCEEPLWNWGLVMDKEDNNQYCRTLSPSLMRVWEISEDKTISYYISARNELGETTTTETYYFTYQEEPLIFCGDEVVDIGEECDRGEFNGISCDNSTSSCDYCNSICELITLPYSKEPTPIKDSKSIWQISLDKRFCEPNWKCSGWSECENSWSTRNCYDANHCALSYNKPMENLDCGLISKVFVEQEEKNSGGAYLLLGGIITLILLIVLVSLLRKK